MTEETQDDKQQSHQEEYKEKLIYVARLSFLVLVYGFIINFILNQLIDYPISFKSLLAFGFIAYLVKVELPPILSSCFPRPPPMMPIG